MRAFFNKYTLIFKRAGGTSRGVLHTKSTYFIYIENEGFTAMGECNLFEGLSADDVPEYEQVLTQVCQEITEQKTFDWEKYRKFPSIQFGVEQAMLSLKHRKQEFLFNNAFSRAEKGIQINGLIWMGSVEFMQEQIKEKLAQGFSCIKIKIGTNWQEEKAILKQLRQQFSAEDLELRVDANGAFSFEQAQEVLQDLAELKIHSIEQPIKAGNWEQMAKLCQITPTPIALDEELIGVFDFEQKADLLQKIKPQYIILKPALVGGFQGSREWVQLAEQQNIAWWITSALESNVGLNAIAQFTAEFDNDLPQGLGTGGLFTNNIAADLAVRGEKLWRTQK
ncbi:o-succinylbenzoate synthase [Ornithobacterium rhinotracheale]|uniref:o-succinylbenzoate synthase n=1 Tax=Ornithobacterium rhinotracheale TaxID=28251 RepID=UPI004036FEE1